MWESPINVMEIQDSFVSEIKEKTEEMVFTEIKRIGIDVDKEELIKALQYDRNQYEKGHKDGYEFGIDRCIRIIEETTWKDTDMLVESIRELKRRCRNE